MSTILDFQVRAAHRSDMTGVSALMRKSASKFIVPDLTHAAASHLLASLDEESLLYSYANCIQYWVAESEGELAGVFGIKSVNHVLHCFVEECHQRRGVGRLMWQFVLREASTQESDPQFTVNSSLYAVPFYKELGFIAVSGVRQREGVKFVPMLFGGRDCIDKGVEVSSTPL